MLAVILMGTDRKLTVLIIDDCDTFCRFVEEALRRADRRIVTFRQVDGLHGIEHLSRCGREIPVPDLVLVDRLMPGGPDGCTVLRALRQMEPLARVQAFMCCGSDEEEHVLQARAAGADDYLVKPVQQDQFADFARQVCSRLAESWRNSGGPVSDQSLALREPGVPSLPMHSPAPTVIDLPSVQDENTFLRAFHAVRDFVVKSFDPVDYAINEACRKHSIPVSHARGRGGDYITVRNRNRVILDLMDGEFGDRVILDNFQVSKRGLERLRAEWRGQKGGGSLAVAKI